MKSLFGILALSSVASFALLKLWSRRLVQEQPKAVFRIKIPDIPIAAKKSSSGNITESADKRAARIVAEMRNTKVLPHLEGWAIDFPPVVLTDFGIVSFMYDPKPFIIRKKGEEAKLQIENKLKIFREGIQIKNITPPDAKGHTKKIVFPEIVISLKD